MDYTKVIRDFAIRTRYNLHFIEEQNQPPTRYEVTQLINSLLGLIVFPSERVLGQNGAERIPSEWWELIITDYEAPTFKAKDNSAKIRRLRNSIAHCRVRVLRVDERGEIEELQFWDKNPRYKVITWVGHVSVSTLRKLADEIVSFIEESELFENDLAPSDPLSQISTQEHKLKIEKLLANKKT